MRRRIAAALALTLLLLPGARAESKMWTTRAEECYHASAHCFGGASRVPISAEAAELFGKRPCPLCVGEAAPSAEPSAVVRGGTVALRFSDAWLMGPETIEVFDLGGAQFWAGEAAQRALAGFLHGEAYAAFMEDWGADGRAEGHARAPEILPLPGKLIMAARRVGGAWFVIVRPESIEGERWEAVCRVGSYRLEMNGEVLRAELEQQSLEDRIELELERVGEVRAVYEFPQARVEIYHELGVDIAVIYAQADERLGADARFCIGDAAAGISMRGYVKGDEWVYCCILTEAEAARLADGEAPRVENAADGARALMSPDGMFGGA